MGGCEDVVIAHNSATGAVLWLKEMRGSIEFLRIHWRGAVLTATNCSIVVLDVTNGHQLHSLPSAGENVRGLCVFDGSANDRFHFLIFF